MSPSAAKGINIRVFVEAQKNRMDIENPNLCGRFRQLEVIEQVTSAFSSLLKNVHSVQNCGGKENVNAGNKSTLTKEKWKRVYQLLRKVSKQAKKLDQNSIQCSSKTQPCENKENRNEILMDKNTAKVFRKTRRHIPQHGSLTLLTEEQLPAGDNIDLLSHRPKPQRNTTQVFSIHTPVKHYILQNDMTTKSRIFKGPKVLSKILRRTSGQDSLQPPDSFELEEIQSFEEESPRGINHDSLSDAEMTRTNSCQSDSSGFQEETPEPLPLQTLHKSLNLSSEHIDSQATLMEKKYSIVFQEDYNINFSATPEDYENCATPHSDSTQKDQGGVRSDTGQYRNEASFLQECLLGEQIGHQEEHMGIDDSPYVFPIYITHYPKECMGSHNEATGVICKENLQDNPNECVSEIEGKNITEQDQFTDQTDECPESSLELSDTTRTSQPISDFMSSNCEMQTHRVFADYLSKESKLCQNEKKTIFQTKLNTNIYKSVTIQMPSNLMSNVQTTNLSECVSGEDSFFTTQAERNEFAGHMTSKYDTLKKEAFSQTEMVVRCQCSAHNHCLLQRSCFLMASLSFDNGLSGLYHPYHQTPRGSCIHCCHCCHHHWYSSRFPSVHQHNGPMSCNLNYSSIETELKDTLKLLKDSLTDVLQHTDHDMETMKKACQRFRNKLLEIEQLLTEQQAGCLTAFSSEGREEIGRMHLLRQSVLHEVSELEFHLDEKAQHVSGAISMQLDQLLEEQSRLYSELELYNREQERKSLDQYDTPQTIGSCTSSACTNSKVHPQDNPGPTATPLEQENNAQSQSQKIDFSVMLQNIKRTFRNFNNP
ncbi:hypothetical protein FKM82_006629 [Ascaphus truei]